MFVERADPRFFMRIFKTGNHWIDSRPERTGQEKLERSGINMKKNITKIAALGLAAVMTFGLAACGSDAASASNTAHNSGGTSEDGVRTIYYAFTTEGANSYIDENGNPDGYEFAAVNAVFDLLPQYQLEFVPTSDEDLLVGLESGKYDVGTKGAWWTAAREEKYVFPEHYIGTSIIGITFRTEVADKVTDLESFARYSGNLVPISPQNAQYNIIQHYNETHPDAQVNLTELDNFSSNDAYQWVLEGRYDAYVDIRSTYDRRIAAEDGEYHQYADQLSYVTYEAIPTWAFFNKNDQEVADAFDEAWEQLYEQGVFEELAQKYFGYSLFDYVPEGYRKGDQL